MLLQRRHWVRAVGHLAGYIVLTTTAERARSAERCRTIHKVIILRERRSVGSRVPQIAANTLFASLTLTFASSLGTRGAATNVGAGVLCQSGLYYHYTMSRSSACCRVDLSYGGLAVEKYTFSNWNAITARKNVVKYIEDRRLLIELVPGPFPAY